MYGCRGDVAFAEKTSLLEPIPIRLEAMAIRLKAIAVLLLLLL